jgi:phosphonoacetaldehyde hydrolase
MDDCNQRRYRGPLRAVLCDWAGTLVDHGSRAPVEAVRAAFVADGVEITVAEARAPMGLAKRDHIRAITRLPRVAAAWHAARGRDFTDGDVERFYQRFLPLSLDLVRAHAQVIDGAVAALAAFRERGLRVGSSTGYTKEQMEVLMPEAERQGLRVDAMACASDVREGRPAPFLAFLNAIRLGVYPMCAMVKIGDTIADVEEGLNAGMWTIAVSRTGNELGLLVAELGALAEAERRARIDAAAQRLMQAGAHYVVESIADCPPLVDEIARRVARGEQP